MSFLNSPADMFINALPPILGYLFNTNFFAVVALLAYASAWLLTMEMPGDVSYRTATNR